MTMVHMLQACKTKKFGPKKSTFPRPKRPILKEVIKKFRYTSRYKTLAQSCAKVFIWIRYRYSQGTDIYFETNINIDIINFLFRNQYQYRYYKFYYFEIETNINIQNASFRYRYQYRNCNNHILANISKRYQYRNQYFTFNKYLKNSSKMLSNLQMLEFRNQYQYQYWTWGHFETNINIDIALEVISKPITKSKFSYLKIATEIDTISIFSRYFDIKTNIVFKTNHFRTPLVQSW